MISTKPPRCKWCKERTERIGKPLHDACVDPWYEANKEKLAKKVQQARAKVERAETKRRKQAIETIPGLIRAADKAFAEYIRERDRRAGHRDISSDKPLDWSGNQVDAGHYRSRGAASHLRYNEDNCHAQSKYENRHRAGNAVNYRIFLIGRIGLERVEALEADNTPHKWDRDELRQIAATYRAKTKELRKETA